jgi:putative transposase
MNSEQGIPRSERAAPEGSDRPAANRHSGHSCPPYNPELHELVKGKQTWAGPLSRQAKEQGFRGWHQRGYLPHHDVPRVTQLITLRLHDAMPASRRGEWEALLRIEDNRQRRTRLEAYLDRGHGVCWLRQPLIAGLVEGALRFFDSQRYQLRAWVVMPNHIHVLVEIWELPLAHVIHSWKGFTARAANRSLKREGTFWQREYWDMRSRNDEQTRKAVHYIEANPVKAGLVPESKRWAWSSARFRDTDGVLRLPTPAAKGAAKG